MYMFRVSVAIVNTTTLMHMSLDHPLPQLVHFPHLVLYPLFGFVCETGGDVRPLHERDHIILRDK